MLSNRVVVQKILPGTGRVRLFQNFDLQSPWSINSTTECRATGVAEEIFPFEFDPDVRFHQADAGRETKTLVTRKGTLLFSDEYVVPEGFLIGIVFPVGFAPEVLKFSDKPKIPIGISAGTVVAMAPGHFDVHFNHFVMKAAIAFTVTQASHFGFKCIARDRRQDFPKVDRYPFYDDLLPSLEAAVPVEVEISASDLESYRKHFRPDVSLEEVAKQISEILQSHNDLRLRTNGEEVFGWLSNALSTSGSALTIVDSGAKGGVVGTAIAKVLAYAAL